ncbi:uncharacterized protein LOC113091074 [Xyrichtys novacula]|uniref:Uncharacterized protein LOC113091074 n=1 Tax=Xyrichtys novacula TaxID=13765 RepID=A0AAV1HA47_XYRNO|nr:uncharacterized protein LOC113091074 [Xyrichtys novacula]
MSKRIKRIPPIEDAKSYIRSSRDKQGVVEKFINDIKGRGVFATQKIQAGDFVLEYRGELITLEQCKEKCYSETQSTFLYEFQWQKQQWCIDASKEDGSLGRLANDNHKSPNCTMKKVIVNNRPHLCLFAVKDIAIGAEIDYNYGSAKWPWRTKNMSKSSDQSKSNSSSQNESKSSSQNKGRSSGQSKSKSSGQSKSKSSGQSKSKSSGQSKSKSSGQSKSEFSSQSKCESSSHTQFESPCENSLESSSQNSFTSIHHLRGSDCIRQFVNECGNIKNPRALTSTKLRKHIATLSTVLNLKTTELDQLADFLGHNIDVHRKHYRLPEGNLQLAKISKVLLALEQGQLGKYKGKSLDEINIDVNETVDVEAGSQEDTERVETGSQEDTEGVRAGFQEDTDGVETGSQEDTDGKQTVIKRSWKPEECTAVQKHLRKFIVMNQVPGKADCERCIAAEPEALKDRDWKAIKYYVKNRISTLRRKLE